MAAEITLAVVAGAHGIGGAVRLKLFTPSLESLEAHRVFLAGDRALTLIDIRAEKTGAVARFAEVKDRNAAEALRGTLLNVPRESLPPLEDGEYYHADYLGREVQAPDGTVMGTVRTIENFGAGDILDITLTSGKSAMVPFTAEAVTEQGDQLIIDPIWLT
ncbi:hypothetical protein GCM10007973_14700 [Polymorphobacter multimanifer]|uniref:Ribosome maturation factor RimM n=1 Tax=Polymorphobacter multimanifer TaxID=1070431 RepID=A0A841L571_9SPHN|nr:ribosome maturation factor RimM [Polymorphobacter multimanifer]MBB6227416.1 16S rRNA processing protein RimM [Polymorphobacter multimanifer]GGI79139.1 hypothetical protein GCM10007973_14700 [Polymorphobacter multimanifer]